MEPETYPAPPMQIGTTAGAIALSIISFIIIGFAVAFGIAMANKLVK